MVSSLGGVNTLAQALWDLQEGANKVSANELEEIIKKIRVYDIAGQDNSGAWIAATFPDILYLRSAKQFRAFSVGGDVASIKMSGYVQDDWFEKNVRSNHGTYGSLYPGRSYMWEGDTPAFLYLVNNGLSDPEYPHYGSWGGRFNKEKTISERYQDKKEDYTAKIHNNASDNSDITTPLMRWAKEYQNDFAARLDWTMTSDKSKVNHQPIIVIGESDDSKDIIKRTVAAGDKISLSASNSYDPDNNGLTFKWWNYPEAGTFPNSVTIPNAASKNLSFTVPQDAKDGETIHIILSVTDDASHLEGLNTDTYTYLRTSGALNGTLPVLTSYRRVVITVGEPEPIKILPMGNSLTQGQVKYANGSYSNEHYSYRKPLWNLLKTNNYTVDYIGSMNTVKNAVGNYYSEDNMKNDGSNVDCNMASLPSGFDTDHEGHYGWTTSWVIEKLDSWIDSYASDPDIVLLMLGSNDLRNDKPNSLTPEQVCDNIEIIINTLTTEFPDVAIMLGNLPPTTLPNRQTESVEFNNLLPSHVATWKQQGYKVTLVNHYESMEGYDIDDITHDEIHPNDLGEEIMAQNWFNAIQAYLEDEPQEEKPTTPSNVSASSTEYDKVTLSWARGTGGGNPTSYTILRSASENGTYTSIGTATSTSYQDAGLSENTTYYYKVVAKNSVGESGASDAAQVTTAAKPTIWDIPGEIPADESIECYGLICDKGFLSNTTNGSWANYNVDIESAGTYKMRYNITSKNSYGIFNIQIKTGDGTFETLNADPITVAETGGWDVSTLVERNVDITFDKVGKQTLRIYVQNPAFNITYFKFDKTDEVVVPGTPVNLSANATSSSVDLSWQAASTGGAPEHYIVERSTDMNTYVVVNDNVKGLQLTDAGLSPGANYYYRVKAVNSAGTSSASNAILVKTGEVPTSITIGVDFGASNKQSSGNWNNITDPEYGSVSDLIDFTGRKTGISIAITDKFNKGANTDGYSANSSFEIPTNASGDSFFGSRVSAVGGDQIKGVLTISNLDPSGLYTLTLFASRGNVGDSRETKYIVKGASTEVGTIEAANNTNAAYIVEMNPTSSGVIEVTATAGENTSCYYYLGALKISTSKNEPLDLPDAPQNLNAANVQSTSASISWSPATTGGSISTYSIERSVNGGAFQGIATISANARSYQDNGLVSNTNYSYRVQAENSVGKSPYSAVLDIKTLQTITIPDAPQGLAATVETSSFAILTWSAAATGSPASSYILERSSNGGTFQSIATPTASETSYQDNGLVAGTSYSYRLKAKNSAGTSGASSVVSFTTEENPVAEGFTVLFNFGSSSSISPWNNCVFTKSGPGYVFNNVYDSNGNATNISVYSPIAVQSSSNGVKSGYTSTPIFPKEVLGYSAIVKPGYDTYSFTFSGLSTNYTYDLKMTGSINTDAERIATYTIGQVSKQLNAARNYKEFVSFEKVEAGADGTITLEVSRVSYFGFINGLEMTAYPKGGTKSAKTKGKISRTVFDQTKLSIYPNPTEDFINIKSPSTMESLLIFDLQGKLKKEESPKSNQASIDVRGLAQGAYVVKIRTKENKVVVKKIIIDRK